MRQSSRANDGTDCALDLCHMGLIMWHPGVDKDAYITSHIADASRSCSMGLLECTVCFSYWEVKHCLPGCHCRPWLVQYPVLLTLLTVAHLLPGAIRNREGYQGKFLHLKHSLQWLACSVFYCLMENEENIEHYIWKEMSCPSLI